MNEGADTLGKAYAFDGQATCSSASRSSTATSGSSVFRSFARSAASAAGREITRDLLGTAPCRTPAAGVAEPSGRGQGCQQV